jgi:hypothetical protein
MNIKEEDILDREELRNVMAGCGGSLCPPKLGNCYTCKCYSGSGYTGYLGTAVCTDELDMDRCCSASYPGASSGKCDFS